MKKELLRINRLNYNYTRTRKLENVSFCILEGECIGFLGLSYSGKDLMTSLLRGELTEGDGSGAIYLGGQKVNDWEVLGKEMATRAFAMRLMHMGKEIHWIWDDTTPSIGEGDLLIATLGDGRIGHRV